MGMRAQTASYVKMTAFVIALRLLPDALSLMPSKNLPRKGTIGVQARQAIIRKYIFIFLVKISMLWFLILE
jgi:hypothetical protein